MRTLQNIATGPDFVGNSPVGGHIAWSELSYLRGLSRLRDVGATFPFPDPSWLAPWSDPVVEGMLDLLNDEEWRLLYRRFLAEEVRALDEDQPEDRRDGILPLAWYAFVRAGEVLRRRNTEERPG